MAAEDGMVEILAGYLIPPPQMEFESSQVALRSDIARAETVERYARIWRFGNLAYTDELVLGRLGFEGPSAYADVWDETSHSFVPRLVPRGVASSFVIRLPDFRIVFQPRPPDVKPRSFTGALLSLLRQPSGRAWQIELDSVAESYSEWRRSIRSVTHAKGLLRLPNPTWQGRPHLETFFDNFALERAGVNLKFSDDATADEIAREMVDHAERGYGRATIVGERRQDGATVTYRTEEGGRRVAENLIPDEAGEVTPAALSEALPARPEVDEHG